MSPATLDIGPAVVANHRRYAPADAVLGALERLGYQTADELGTYLDFSTRDVVATLKLLAAWRTVCIADVARDIREADLIVLRVAGGTGDVIRSRDGVQRYFSRAEMAVLEQHQPVTRRVPNNAAGEATAVVWALAAPEGA